MFWGLLLVALALLVNGAVGYAKLQEIRQQEEANRRARAILDTLHDIDSIAHDAVPERRSSANNSQTKDVQSSKQVDQLNRRADTLMWLVVDNAEQVAAARALKELIEQEQLARQAAVKRLQEDGLDGVLAPAGDVINDLTREQIHTLVGKMESRERSLFDAQEGESEHALAIARFTIVAGVFLGLGLAIGAYWVVGKERDARRLAEFEVERGVSAWRQSEAQLRAMSDSVPGVLYAVDSHGATTINRWFFEYTGLTPEQTVGQGIEAAVHPDDLFALQRGATANVAQPLVEQVRIRLRNSRGIYRWFLLREIVVKAPSGTLGRVGLAVEIDELVNAEVTFREADRRRDQFLATLAHELRNPIAPISNVLEILPQASRDPAQLERLHGIMQRQLKQLIRLIDDLLDVSRITRNKIQLRKESVEIATVVNGAIESVRPMIERYGHVLHVDLPEAQLLVEGDVARLVQVVSNVMHNAAKYTPQQGQIWLSVAAQGSHVEIRVRDNGEGIPTEMLEHVFEMFTQVDQTVDRAHGGLGIGLTLVKSLVEMHHGTIEARSAGAGQGSEFVIRLPLIPASLHAPAKEPPLDHKPALQRHRVLVVDDIQASAKTLAMMLSTINQQVTTCNDGPAAIEAVQRDRPDVVFLDIGMPGMDGYEVARRLRANPDLASLTLVALTGYGQTDDRRQAHDAGFDHHLVKPASLDVLEQLLASVPVSFPANDSVAS